MRELLFRLRQACIVGVTLVLSACASILGVEEANCDPGFDPACAADAGNVDTTESEDAGEPGELSQEQVCDAYCTEVGAACTEFPQYLNAGGCNTVCNGMLSLAAPEDGPLDDTIECRATAARTARNFEDDRADFCQAAGPMGVGCGDECTKYCDYMARLCPEAFAEELGEDCISECEDVPRKEIFIQTDTYDDTLECRFLHIQLSIQQSPLRPTHCGHAVGIGGCVD
jgi:hypothetical protein